MVTTIIKNFLSLSLLLLLTIPADSRVMGNGAGSAFSGEGEGFTRIENNQSVETQVEIAGGYFLEAQSNISKFANLVEMSNVKGIDYAEWNKILDSAITNIRNAKSSYAALIKTAESTPYNMQFIYRLWYFDYDGFRVKYGLNRVIFNELKGYLYYGDISGVFYRIHSSLIEIEKLLLIVKNSIILNKFPDINVIWRIDEGFAELVLFGQYSTRIFYSL